MEQIFDIVLKNSLTGIAFLAVILGFRRATRNISKVYVHLLWILLLVELLTPPLIGLPFYSIYDVSGIAERSITDGRMAKAFYNLHSFASAEIEAERNKETGDLDKESGNGEENRKQAGGGESLEEGNAFHQWFLALDIKRAAAFVWLTGALAVALFYLEQFLKLKRCVRTAARTADGIWESENVKVPFVLIGFPSKIYFPLAVEGKKRTDILAHEKQHLKHFDPWVKCLAALALAVHWFHPFFWLAFRLMDEDMEMFCDEGVLQGKSLEEKKQYSKTMLDFAAKENGFSLSLSFGEGNTKKRIVHIFRVKKARFGLGALLAAVVLFCGVFFLTSGSTQGMENNSAEYNAAKNDAFMKNNSMKENSSSADGNSAEGKNASREDNSIEGKNDFMENNPMEDKNNSMESARMEDKNNSMENNSTKDKNSLSENLTIEMVWVAYEEGRIGELDYFSFGNGEREEDEWNGSYGRIYFFLARGEEEYRLDVSIETEKERVEDIYLVKLSTGEMKWLYTFLAEPPRYQRPAPVDLEAFFSHKTSMEDWLAIELPKGFAMSDYNAWVGLYEGGGAVIGPQAYRTYGEDLYFPEEWSSSGAIARIDNAEGMFCFENGRIIDKEIYRGNHAGEETVETIDGLSAPAFLCQAAFDLYTIAELDGLREQGILVPEEETVSYYWNIYFAQDGKDVAYCLALAQNAFTKEEAIAAAATVRFREDAFEN